MLKESMDSGRWRQINEIFHAALEVRFEERAAFLATACAGDAGLLGGVTDLLDTEPPTRFLETRPWETAISSPAVNLELSLEAAAQLVAPRFEIRRAIGSGGFGQVFEAHDRMQDNVFALKTQELQTPVAIKVLHLAGGRAALHLQREFRVLADLSHPNLVRMYEFFSDEDGGSYFTMELVEGEDLLTAVRRPGVSLRSVFRQLALGISRLHQAGILHCDLKPSNVLVGREGRAVVLDFGVSIPMQQATAHFGSPRYASPEQKAGDTLTPASDWYSAGVMLFEAVCGRAIPEHRDAAAGLLADAGDPGLARLCLDLIHDDPRWRPEAPEILARLGPGEVRTEPEEVFAGREKERSHISAAFGKARRGPVILRVSGPAGIGKTSLARACQRELGQLGATVLYSVCRERESVPFKAFDDMAPSIVKYVQGSGCGDAALLGSMFPELASTVTAPRGDAVDRRSQVFDAFIHLLRTWAAHERLVFWIDDAQWGDRDSANLLVRLIHSPEPPRILIVISHRPEDSEFLARLSGAGQELALDPLPVAVAADVASRLLGVAPDDARAAQLASESGGDPFMLAEFARGERARIEAGISTSAAPLDFAETLRQRLAQLPAAERTIAEAVAVAASSTPWNVIRLAAEDSYAALVRLRNERLLRTSMEGQELHLEPYHDRVSALVRRSLDPTRARTLHRRLADAFEKLDPGRHEVLAWHRFEAGDLPAALRYAESAADRAVDALAFATAARYYRMALSCGAGRDPWLRLKFARALECAGLVSDAAETYSQLAAEATGTKAEELRLNAAKLFMASGETAKGINAFRLLLQSAGLSMVESHRWALVRAVAIRVPAWICFLLPNRRRDPSPARARQMELYWTVAAGLFLSDPLHTLEFQARYFLLAMRYGNASQRARALMAEALALATLQPGRQEWAQRLLQRAEREKRGLESPLLDAVFSYFSALVAILGGNWREAADACISAEPLLQNQRENCWGELGWIRRGISQSLYFCGELKRLRERLPSMCREADDRGRVQERLLHLRMIWLDLAQSGDAAAGRTRVAEWAAQADEHDQMHRYHCWNIQVEVEFYDGNFAQAWNLARENWPRFKRDGMAAARAVVIEGSGLYAFAALHATDEPAKIVRAEVRRLERMGVLWATAVASALEAGLALKQNDCRTAIRLMEQCEASFAQAKMRGHEMAARFHRGVLMGNAELVTTAGDWMRDQGVVDPHRAARIWLPVRAALAGGTTWPSTKIPDHAVPGMMQTSFRAFSL